MLNPIQILLERMAERCIALAAGMLATTIESLEIAYQVQQRQKLADLASQYDAAGLADMAAQLRELAQGLVAGSPAIRGEALLREAAALQAPFASSEHADLLPGSILPGPDKSSSHRANGRARRVKPAVPTPGPATDGAADSHLFFPLSPDAPAADQKVTE